MQKITTGAVMQALAQISITSVKYIYAITHRWESIWNVLY
ncbi:hypothetical protein HNQ54_003624 [Anaerocolumna cellulosilytica]|nr:hypothetical protein [Anaerocolumna cellulosilytica]